MSEFHLMAKQFEEEQRRLADSAEMVRKDRYAYYRNRYPRREYNRYSVSSKWRDSISSKPLSRQERRCGYAIVKVNINRCDTGDVTRVPQFGSKRAVKLLEYREKLGGYYSLSQVKEVYILQNMPAELLDRYFEIDLSAIRKIKINRATYKEMISHPYFDAYLVKTIINYRQKHGAIRSASELQSVTHAYPELMDKITPYISFE